MPAETEATAEGLSGGAARLVATSQGGGGGGGEGEVTEGKTDPTSSPRKQEGGIKAAAATVEQVFRFALLTFVPALLFKDQSSRRKDENRSKQVLPHQRHRILIA